MLRTGVQGDEFSRAAAGQQPASRGPMEPATGPATRFPLAGTALVTLCAFALYARTRSAFPSWDTLHYAADTAAAAPAGLASAHHPLGTLLAYGVHRTARAFGLTVEALVTLQLTSAACAAVALGGLYAVLRRAGACVAAAAGATLGLGGSLAFWEAATDGGVYAAAAAALIVAWGALLTHARDSLRRAAAAGVAGAAAALAHQFNGVLAIWASLWLWRVGQPAAAAVFCLATAVTAALGYALTLRVSRWAWSSHGFAAWWTHYLRLGLHWPAAHPLSGALSGVANSVVRFSPPDRACLACGLSGVAAAVTLLAVVGVAVVAFREAEPTRQRPVGLAALVALSAGGLAAWWEPGTRTFWVPALASAWLAIGLALARAAPGRVVALGLTAVALTALNLAAVMLPRADASANPYPRIARRIAAVTAPDDLLIVGTDILGPSLAYYGDRPNETSLFAIFLEAARTHGDPYRYLHRLIEHAWQQGGRVFISSDALDIDPARRAMVAPLPTTLTALLPALRRVPVLYYSVGGPERGLFMVLGRVDSVVTPHLKSVRGGS